MARRRVAYRKRNQNRLSMMLVTLVVLMLVVVVAAKSVELQGKLDAKAMDEGLHRGCGTGKAGTCL